VENAYTLAEFFEPLVKRLKDKLKLPNKQHALVTLLDDLQSSTVFRNYCAHWKNESSPFTTPEIDEVFKKWLAILQKLYCDSCKSFVVYVVAGSTEYVKCDCGTLDLKAASN
jgi:hypothetical protein